MNADFLEQNRTYGVHYITEEFDENTGSTVQTQHIETNAPSTRDLIVDSQNKFKEIFKDFEDSINFETEMLIIHMFTDTNPRPVMIKSVEIKDKKLIAKFSVQPSEYNVNDGTVPGQKCFAIKIDKTDISDVEFIKK